MKFFLSAWLPLAPDEAYYHVWSQYLQLSYFDHPPMVAWLIYLSEKIGWWLPSSELALRWGGVALHHGTIWIVIRLYQNLQQKVKIGLEEVLILLLLLFHPLLGFFQILQTPDLPLLFFWSLSTLIFFQLLDHRKTWQFLLLGLTLGAGFVSKYMIALWGLSLIVFFVLYLFKIPQLRTQKLSFLIAPKNIVLGVMGLFIASSPVWIWNQMHDWISFRFQINHGFEAPGFEAHWVFDYLGGALLLCGSYLACLKLSKINSYKEAAQSKIVFLGVQLLVSLLFFFNSSFHAPTEVNWPIMGYMNIPLLVVLLGRSLRWVKGAAAVSFAVTGVLIVLLGTSGVKIPQLEQMKNLKALGKRLSLDVFPLYTCKYQTAATLSFYSPYPVYKLQDCSRYDFYDARPEFTNHNKTFFIYKTEQQDVPTLYYPAKVTLVTTEEDDHNIYKVERQ